MKNKNINKNNKIVIGLTGGICSGKSVVSDELIELGYTVIDADVISRQITADGEEGVQKIVEIFPSVVVSGSVDRRKLKEIVFGHESERKKLNAALHPLIAEKIKMQIERADAGCVIVVVPLLFETGFDAMTDVTVTVSCLEKTRIERLIERDNIDAELAEKIIRSQYTDSERESRADYCIRNDGDVQKLRREARKIIEALTAKNANRNKNT